VAAALERIATLYKEEATIRALGLEGVAKLAHRGAYRKPLVDAFFAWLKQTVITEVILPTNPFGQALCVYANPIDHRIASLCEQHLHGCRERDRRPDLQRHTWEMHDAIVVGVDGRDLHGVLLMSRTLPDERRPGPLRQEFLHSA